MEAAGEERSAPALEMARRPAGTPASWLAGLRGRDGDRLRCLQGATGVIHDREAYGVGASRAVCVLRRHSRTIRAVAEVPVVVLDRHSLGRHDAAGVEANHVADLG